MEGALAWEVRIYSEGCQWSPSLTETASSWRIGCDTPASWQCQDAVHAGDGYAELLHMPAKQHACSRDPNKTAYNKPQEISMPKMLFDLISNLISHQQIWIGHADKGSCAAIV